MRQSICGILLSSCTDDIDLDDHEEKHKDQSILGALNKKKLTGKFQALKGWWLYFCKRIIYSWSIVKQKDMNLNYRDWDEISVK